MGERACPTSHRVRTKRRRAGELVDLVVERRSCHVSRGPLVRRLAACMVVVVVAVVVLQQLLEML